MMKDKPRILFLEDAAADYLLVNRELSQSGLAFDAKRVDTKEEFLKELSEHPPDLILSDHGLHEFDAFSALAIAKEKAPNVPFVFLTGSLGEETAIRALKSGATDYVLKQRLSQLAPAVRRALQQTEQPASPSGPRDKAIREGDEQYRHLVESVREGEQQLSLAVEAAGVGTWDYNSLTGEATWSERCKAAFGLPPDSHASFENFMSRIHPEDRSRVQQTVHRAMEPGSSGRYDNEYRVLWPDGTLRWIISKGQVFFQEVDGVRKPVRFIGALLDVTDRKDAEQALRNQIQRFNGELEQRVAQRTAQLEAANKELEAFSYSVSHDLRAPLRHIDGFAELLQQSLGKKLEADDREYLHIITESAHQMGRLIDALLAFSRMGRAAMHVTRVNMNHLVHAALHDLHYDAEGRKIDWVIADLPEVTGDPSLLRQAVLNLISNALKYTRTREQARIEIGSTSDPQETVFFVRDNGIGFDMRYADKLFGVFQRLHGAAQFEGTGIGLANVRRIIQRHGGRTWAEAVLDQGATFYFSLPHPSPHPPIATEPPPARGTGAQ